MSKEVQSDGVLPGITDEVLDLLEGSIGILPVDYRMFLKSEPGMRKGDGVFLYSVEDIVERNETFEVTEYAPEYLAIGDDGGGRAIMLHRLDSGVYLVDQGSMDPDDMVRIGNTFHGWLEAGATIPAI